MYIYMHFHTYYKQKDQISKKILITIIIKITMTVIIKGLYLNIHFCKKFLLLVVSCKDPKILI